MNTHRFDLSLFAAGELRQDYLNALNDFVPDDKLKDFNENFLVLYDQTDNVDKNKHYCHGYIVKIDAEKTFEHIQNIWYDINNARGFKIKDSFETEYICPWRIVHKNNVFKNDPGPKVVENSSTKVDIEKKKPKLNLDPSLLNYMDANDFLKSMFKANANKTIRVLKKIYLPIMIEGKMLEIADSEEEIKQLKEAYKKLNNKNYKPDLRTNLFAKMKCACDDTGASYEKMKTLNAAKGGYSKAAKWKFSEK